MVVFLIETFSVIVLVSSLTFDDESFIIWSLINMFIMYAFLPERDFVTFGSLLSQIRLSVACNVRVPYSGG